MATTKVKRLGRPGRAFWPDAGEGPWELRFEWADVGGRATCIGFTIRWADVAGPRSSDSVKHVPLWDRAPDAVTTSLLRSLPFASLVQESRRMELQVSEVVGSMSGVSADERRKAKAQGKVFRKRAGRPPVYGDDHYREVAAVYAQAYRDGLAPTTEVAGRFGVSRSAAAKWVATARDKKFLGPTEERRAGGVPAKRKGRR